MLLFNTIFILIMTLVSIAINGFKRPSLLRQRYFKSSLPMSTTTSLIPEYTSEFKSFLDTKAKVPSPKNIDLLLELLIHKGEIPVSPVKSRAGLNPLLIPVTKNPIDNSLTCYLRWPTQKDGAPLQLVKTTETGLYLVSLDTDKYCHRLAVEMDFAGDSETNKFVEKINKIGIPYKVGDYLPMIKSGKFPTLTKEDLALIIDRFILTKVGAFPDAYERLALNFLKSGSEVSAFVTCERAISLFYGWGHPMSFNALLIGSQKGRESEGVSMCICICICISIVGWLVG